MFGFTKELKEYVFSSDELDQLTMQNLHLTMV